MTTTCSICNASATTQCVQCRAAVCGEHKITGQPFITARQLLTAIVHTALRTPSLLSDMLFKELDLVDYCPACREAIGARRQTEQLKFAGGLFVAMLAVVALPILLYMS